MTLEVVKYQDVVKVTAIPGFVAELGVPAIEVIGEDFRSVESVSINEAQVPEFVVLNRTKMWVQLPPGVQAIRSIEVLSHNFTKTSSGSVLKFKVGTKSREVRGILRLTQLFTKWLLQTPGSDIFNPDRGGGLQEVVGSLVSAGSANGSLGSVTRAVATTAQQIRNMQMTIPGIPLDERLLSAEFLGLNVFQPQMEARARVRITAANGREAVNSLSL